MAVSTRPLPEPADQGLWSALLAIAEHRRELAAAHRAEPGQAPSPRLDAMLARAEMDAKAMDAKAMDARATDASAAAAADSRTDEPSPAELIALYRPLLSVAPGNRHVSAHLGQSIDGHIATRDGRSRGLNGDGNLDHLHRMRALSDAIVVGAGTVIADDPALTTRRVAGRNPVRVVLDGRGRIDARYRICRDGDAPTLILSGRARTAGRIGRAEVMPLPRDGEGRPDVATALTRLGERGLHVIFVEGGGITVSRLLQAGLLDRLQITIAPVLFGGGVRGLSLASVGRVEEALRPPVRQFRLGPDRLWDFALKG